jgi:hypothetical protein
MKRSVASAVVIAMMLTLAALTSASPAAAATTVCVSGTANAAPCPAGQGPGGAYTLSSTNFRILLANGTIVACTTATISGTAPAGTVLIVSNTVTLGFGGCTAAGLPTTVVPAAACAAGGGFPIVMTFAKAVNATTLQVPAGCTITINVPAIACTMTLAGAQIIGNGGSGAGGQLWTNAAAPAFSTDVFNINAAALNSGGGGFGCPAAGAVGGTIAATYTVTAPAAAPGVTLQ